MCACMRDDDGDDDESQQGLKNEGLLRARE